MGAVRFGGGTREPWCHLLRCPNSPLGSKSRLSGALKSCWRGGPAMERDERCEPLMAVSLAVRVQ